MCIIVLNDVIGGSNMKRILSTLTCSALFLCSINVFNVSAVTSTDRDCTFNAKVSENGQIHFEYSYAEANESYNNLKSTFSSHAGYIIKSSEDLCESLAYEGVVTSLSALKENEDEFNEVYSYFYLNSSDSISYYKSISAYAIEKIASDYISDGENIEDYADEIYFYSGKPDLTAEERRAEANEIASSYSVDYIIDLDFSKESMNGLSLQAISFELFDGYELTDDIKLAVLETLGSAIDENYEITTLYDYLDYYNYNLDEDRGFGKYITKDNNYVVRVNAEDTASVIESAESLYEIDGIKLAFPYSDSYISFNEVNYNGTLLYPEETVLFKNSLYESYRSTEAVATEPVDSSEEVTEPDDTGEDVTDPTENSDEKEDDIIYGDVNMDDEINIADAVILNKYLVGATSLSDESMENADVNIDGNVDSTDTLDMLKYIVGTYSSLPPIIKQ